MSILDIIHDRGATQGDRPCLLYLERGERPGDSDTYASLDLRARTIAARLIAEGLQGKAVLLAADRGLAFIHAFLGCLYAGVYPVPVPAVARNAKVERLQLIARAARPVAVLADDDTILAALEEDAVPLLVVGDILASGIEPVAGPVAVKDSDIAFIQYTSGSTSAPKGVVVTHGNIMANEAMVREGFGNDENSVGVSWLPLHHDMGLIGTILQPLYIGARTVLISPLHFLQRPVRWLKAIQAYGATTCGAPNFAYEMCVRLVTPEQAAELDLSTWKLAFCGSEAIRPGTMRRFAEHFAVSGFDPKALYPCYGMAEATLFITGGIAGEGAANRRFSRRLFAEFTAGNDDEQTVTDCGFPRCGGQVAIVTPDGARRLGEGEVGEICVAGPHVSPGLWAPDLPGLIRSHGERLVTVDGVSWLRSGDAGIIVDGHLYVVGRRKDMIIVRGANLYAEDLELTLMDQPEARSLEAVAVIAVERNAAENVVVLCELSGTGSRQGLPAEVAETLRNCVAAAHGVQPSDMILLPPRTLPRTTSGKVQRGVARAAWLDGRLPGIAWLPA